MSAWHAFLWTLRSMLLDPAPLGSAVGGMVLYCFFYPLPYLPETVTAVPVVVADGDRSPVSRAFARNLDATQSVEVVGVVRNVDEAVPNLERGEIGGIVALPLDFYRDALRGTPTGITVMGHGGYVVVDGSVLASAAEAAAATLAPLAIANLVRAHAPAAVVTRLTHVGPPLVRQPLFNTVQGYQSYVVPASMGLIVHQLMIIGICLVIGTWTEGGRWAIAGNEPLSWAAFVGMTAGFSVIVFAAILFWIGFVFWYHDLPRAANLWGAIVFGAIYSIAVTSVGISLGCWLGERERALQIIGAISIPLLFLSGFAFPVESIDEPLVWLSHLLPTTPGIQGFLMLNQMGASWLEVLPQLINLLCLVVIYAGIARLAARRRASGAV